MIGGVVAAVTVAVVLAVLAVVWRRSIAVSMRRLWSQRSTNHGAYRPVQQVDDDVLFDDDLEDLDL